MSSTELDQLKAEKSDLIDQFISLRQKYQALFYKHEETKSENIHLKQQIQDLQNENKELKSSSDTNVHRENKQLVAKVKQLRRSSCAVIATPQKSSPKREKQTVYEVENIVKHRGRKGKREFQKNFSSQHDTWVREADLSCPAILNKYKVKYRIA